MDKAFEYQQSFRLNCMWPEMQGPPIHKEIGQIRRCHQWGDSKLIGSNEGYMMKVLVIGNDFE